jgi:hypothetical protein
MVVGAPWRRWERGGGAHGAGGVPGRRWRDRWLELEKGGGKGICDLVGQLRLLATRWVGPKAIGPKGQTGRHAPQ